MMTIKALVNIESFETTNTKALYKKIIQLFDNYNINKLASKCIAEKTLNRNLELKPEKMQVKNSDSTLSAIIEREKIMDWVFDFEKKIAELKPSLTEEEAIIFHYSLEEREPDKIIMKKIVKTEHVYYQIKKSCYFKIALLFGLVKLKDNH